MRIIILAALMLLIVITMVLAKEPKTTELTGYIVDNKCSGKQSKAHLDEYVKIMTKGCAVSPECKASGYSIYAHRRLYRFDTKSNKKIAEFLQKPDSKLLVVAEVKKQGNKVRLVSLRNGG